MSNTVKEPHLDPPDDDSEQVCPLCGCVIDECEQPEEQGEEPDTGLVYAESHERYWLSREVWEEMKSEDVMSGWWEEDTR